MDGGHHHLAGLLAMGPTPGEITTQAAGATTAGAGIALFAAQDLVAGMSAGAVAAGLMIISGAAIGAYGRWRQSRREEQAKDDDARRASEEEEARHRKRLEEINAGSLHDELAQIHALLDRANQRLEDANAKLHKAASDRQAMTMHHTAEVAELKGQLKILHKQLGLPSAPDPELGSDEQATLPKVVKQAVKEAVRESDDEIATGEWPGTKGESKP